jgi:hypothetical protein
MEWIDWASFPGWQERNNPRDPPRKRDTRMLPDGDNIMVLVDRDVFSPYGANISGASSNKDGRVV